MAYTLRDRRSSSGPRNHLVAPDRGAQRCEDELDAEARQRDADARHRDVEALWRLTVVVAYRAVRTAEKYRHPAIRSCLSLPAAHAVYRDGLRALGVALDEAGPNARARQPFGAGDVFEVDRAARVAFGRNVATGILRVLSRRADSDSARHLTQRRPRVRGRSLHVRKGRLFARSRARLALFHVKQGAAEFQVDRMARRAPPRAKVAAPSPALVPAQRTSTRRDWNRRPGSFVTA